MLKIKAEISGLNKEQRESLAGFILTFPPVEQGSENPIVLIPELNPSLIPGLDPSQVFHSPSPVPPPPAPVTEAAVSSAGPVLVIPPPAPVPVTEAAPAPAAVATSGANLDKAGLPWDERIHAGSKSVTADGLWRKKRGIDNATILKVEAELRALMNISAPAPVAVPPPPAPVTEAAPVDQRQTFVALVGRASSLIQSGKLTQAELQAICASVRVPSLPMLANRLDLVPSFNQLIDSTLASK